MCLTGGTKQAPTLDEDVLCHVSKFSWAPGVKARDRQDQENPWMEM